MQFMQKNTGRQGEGGFFELTKQIAAIPDAAQRAQAAVQVFGSSGMELLPLVNNGEAAIEKFQKLQSIMPGVSTAAANAGDAANDALTIFGKGAQAIMLKAVGKICALWGDEFPGGVRAGALSAVNWLETFFKKAYAYIVKYSSYLGALGGLVADFFTKGPADAWKIYTGTIEAAEHDFENTIKRADASREKYIADLKLLDIDDLANPFGKAGGSSTAGASFGTEAAKRISNALVMGNSNQMNRLAILGPEYQNEQKKQTDLLRKIADNTAKTAEESGESYPETDLGV